MRTRIAALFAVTVSLCLCSCTIDHPHMDVPPAEATTMTYPRPSHPSGVGQR